MSSRLKRVLLVDDNPADVFLHTRVLRKAGCVEQIDSCDSAESALEYLRGGAGGPPPRPDLIFLDINMPGMGGWGFLDAYRALPSELRGGVVIAMLTVSPSRTDSSRAEGFPELAAYLNKPLTRTTLAALLAHHFPDVVVQ